MNRARRPVKINGRRIAPGEPVYVIAEAGMNHNGDMDLAREMIRAAAWAGADAVKFQSFCTDRLVCPGAADVAFRKSVELSPEQHELLAETCALEDVDFLSTPCDEFGIDLLVGLGVGAIKIGSFDVTHLPLLEHAGSKGLPVLLSTGTATLEEVTDAVAAVERGGTAGGIVLMHCVSQYPADWTLVNLRTIGTLRNRFRVPVGWSDHTLEPDLPALAVACGACVIERHFTTDRSLPGPDQELSFDPPQFADMVLRIRAAKAALGKGGKTPSGEERRLAQVARRSLHTVVDVPAGTVLTRAMLDVLRPADGLPPAQLPRVLGRRVRVDVPAWSALLPEHLVEENG